MKVFKYLVALADISVGFLGLFFVIFAVARPTLNGSSAEKRRLEQTARSLREEIRRLEEIKLAKAGAGQKLPAGESAKIIITVQAVTVEMAGQTRRFAGAAAFAALAPRLPWPGSVVLYVDHRVPFERVVQVIDGLKQSNADIAVQIAALAK
jgi:biopolymer transport protein ExbD